MYKIRMSPRLSTIKPREIVRALEKAGFYIFRQKGSHLFMKHHDGRWTTIPMHGKDISRGTLQGILRQSRLTPEQLLELL